MVAAAVLVLVLGLVVVTVPIWIRPFVETWASLAVGRHVSIGNLALSLRGPLRIAATQVTVATAAGVTDAPYLATVEEIAFSLDLGPLLRGRMLEIPDISVSGMEISAVETPQGANNWTFTPLSTGTSARTWAIPSIGVIHIRDSQAHLVMPSMAADVHLTIKTEAMPDNTVVADVTGTYGGQPITGRLAGGAILNLRDAANPYPVDIRLVNGQSSIRLTGYLRDPLHFAAADLKLEMAGKDMADLYPLTGIPVPPTPPYNVTGSLDYAEGVVRFSKITGRIGSTDVNGDVRLDTSKAGTAPARPVMYGAFWSRRVDLEDLAGFIGSQPGRLTTPDQTPAQRQAVAQAIANPRLIPNLPMDVPKIRSVDFHLTYRGESFIGKSVPFDNLATRLDIDDGHIRVTELRVGIGKGQILGDVDMTPVDNSVRTKADFNFQRLDVGRLLSSLKFVRGDGVLGGRAHLEAMGKSLGEMLANGKGGISVFMAGGNVSTLVIDLSGLQFADAALSALGLPNRDPVRCFIGDLALAQGSLESRTLLLDTVDNRTSGQGTINMRTEQVAAQIRTEAKHFTVGSLPTRINISGTLKDPQFAPDPVELGARGAAAVGLGLVFPLAALLPTIQLGTGEDNACTALARGGNSRASSPAQSAKPGRGAPR